jgi:peptidoglycan hydrolase-like protein with peptidoglycan-binding domain
MSRLRSPRSESAERINEPTAERSGARRVLTRIAVLGLCAAIGTVTVLELRHTSTAAADPSAQDWLRLRTCESGNNYSINTGNDHYGAYQFDLSTWRSVGGTGYPYQASAAEQDARALILYRMRGWQPWQCADIVGLREDKDARSGQINDIKVPGGGGSSGGGGTSKPGGSHAWPGVYYQVGDHSTGIKTWQLQMRHRGAALTGSGQFGSTTLAVVKDVQRQNGLGVTGLLGPNTWNLAWSGKYRPGATSKPTQPAPKPTPKPKPRPKPHPKPAPKPGAAPKWTAPQYYSLGDHSATIKAWQVQMHKRGAPLTGSGQFGSTTLSVVKAVQRANHLPTTGILGPSTWKLAWTGKYTKPIVAPKWTAPQYYSVGDHSATIKAWQVQMHKRGAALTGTGQFGPKTLAVVKRLQRANHLPATGILGPSTWKLAWTGHY